MIGYVYKIISNETDKCYVGSTKNKLNDRFNSHKSDYKKYINGNPKYNTSFQIIKYDDAMIVLIDEIEFEDKKELYQLEGKYIKELSCVNRCISGRTRKEYYKEWIEENKDKNKQQRKEYREVNKDKMKEYRKENKNRINETKREYNKKKIICECGSIISRGGKTNHKKTKKHLDYIDNK